MKKRLLPLLIIIFIFIFSSCAAQPLDGMLHVTVLDTGNSDCSIIQMPNGEVMMIDTASNSDYSKIKTFLSANDINQIDYLVVTHPHSDHIGGAAKIIKNYTVKNIYMTTVKSDSSSYESMVSAIDQYNINVIYPSSGDTLKAGDVTVEFLAPLNDYSDLNNTSIVLKITYGKTSFLFTGDIEEAATSDLCTKYGKDLRSDFLKVPHHGSKNTEIAALLDFVKPKISAITCKKENDYNHPNQYTLDALNASKAEIFRTDTDGNIYVSSDGVNAYIDEN